MAGRLRLELGDRVVLRRGEKHDQEVVVRIVDSLSEVGVEVFGAGDRATPFDAPIVYDG